MADKKSSPDNRTRNWNFILYPESAPANWREEIDATHTEWVESPLHDRDKNEDGTDKKPHHHITLLFPGKKSFEQVKEITDHLNQPIPVKCLSVKGSIRYMVHKDNPEKFQYEWGQIVAYGGADLSSLCAPTATENYQIIKELRAFIRDNDIKEYCDLLDCVDKIGDDDWGKVASHNTILFNAYIKSRKHKALEIPPRHENQQRTDAGK
jgi:hypothetical protein